jgi:tight adherence protein B
MGAAMVFLLAGGSAFFLSLLAFEVLRNAFAEYERRYLAPAVRDLGAMFLFIEPRQVLLLNFFALLAMAAIGYWLCGALCAVAAAVTGFFAPSAAVRLLRRRRVVRFNAQLADALQQLANALRAGFTLQQGADQVGRDAGAPLRQEFGLFVKELKLGMPVEAALSAMAERVKSEDLDLLATSTSIARQLGANLAELFEGIAGTIRERFRLEGRIAALTSQGKLQGAIVALLPVIVGVFLRAYRPDLILPMFENAFGHCLLAAIAVLQATGFLLIRRIVAIDI